MRNLRRSSAAILCVSLAGCSSRGAEPNVTLIPIQDDGTTHISVYKVPTLQGWERTANDNASELVQNVTFKKTVDQTNILTEFVVFSKPQGAPADTAQSLREAVLELNRTDKVVDAQRGEKRQILLSAPTLYQGKPAYSTRHVISKGDMVSEIQILRVADGRHTFWIFQSLAGKKGSAATRAVAAQAWKALSNGLR